MQAILFKCDGIHAAIWLMGGDMMALDCAPTVPEKDSIIDATGAFFLCDEEVTWPAGGGSPHDVHVNGCARLCGESAELDTPTSKPRALVPLESICDDPILPLSQLLPSPREPQPALGDCAAPMTPQEMVAPPSVLVASDVLDSAPAAVAPPPPACNEEVGAPPTDAAAVGGSTDGPPLPTPTLRCKVLGKRPVGCWCLGGPASQWLGGPASQWLVRTPISWLAGPAFHKQAGTTNQWLGGTASF